MPSGFKRLAADHAALYDSNLPPNYLFPPGDESDDLTQLTTLLAGPHGTPYSQGLWRLHLKMPEDYPKSPPKATFKTRIWHPNVEESTGAVCVDTLKRDWKSTLTLKDVLITISCLLIYPNPDSALNSSAGALLQEDYEAFARQAKLMTSIHAPVPVELKTAVTEAKLKGEDAGTVIQEPEGPQSSRARKGMRVQSVTMKKNARGTKNKNIDDGNPDTHASLHSEHPSIEQQQRDENGNPTSALSDDENDDDFLSSAAKENDPSLSPSPVKLMLPSPRKNAHGKRPLSVLTMPIESDFPSMEADDSDGNERMMMTASEKNIAANYPHHHHHQQQLFSDQDQDQNQDHDRDDGSPQRKSPKLTIPDRGSSLNYAPREELKIFEDAPPPPIYMTDHDDDDLHHRRTSGAGKENNSSDGQSSSMAHKTKPNHPPTLLSPSTAATTTTTTPTPTPSTTATRPVSRKSSAPAAPGSRKVSSSSSSSYSSSSLNPNKTRPKSKPRIGIRRL